jgi:hypothetical protein
VNNLQRNLSSLRRALRAENPKNPNIVGGRTSARRKPYKNYTRKPSNKARSKRIGKHKTIIERKQATDKQLLNVKVIN